MQRIQFCRVRTCSRMIHIIYLQGNTAAYIHFSAGATCTYVVYSRRRARLYLTLARARGKPSARITARKPRRLLVSPKLFPHPSSLIPPSKPSTSKLKTSAAELRNSFFVRIDIRSAFEPFCEHFVGSSPSCTGAPKERGAFSIRAET